MPLRGSLAASVRMPPPNSPPDTILFNAGAITLNHRLPSAELVAIRGDRIAWVGSNDDLAGLSSRGTKLIDCQGRTLVPGFIDAHCHVIAYASSLLAVDCGPGAVASIGEIKEALRERARTTPSGQWIRGAGYDEFALHEKRHPTRQDLDEAAPSHPARLNHRSGHACVLNSIALERIGVSTATDEPPGGVIERDWHTGEPTGLLMEMDDYLDRLIPPISESELHRGVQLADQRLVSLGITSVQDATYSNSIERWDLFSRLKAEGTLRPRVTMMVGFDHLEQFLECGLRFGAGGDDLNVGAVKIMLTMTTGSLRPSLEELRTKVLQARKAGFQVAIHAVEAEAVHAAAAALTPCHSGGDVTRSPRRDRIEHCSECSPATLRKLAGSGIVVVTQPGFLYYSGQRYLTEMAEERRPWLYRFKSLINAGLSPAGSSDAPVIEPNPLLGIYAAVTRRAETGEVVGESEQVSALETLKMYTLGGAYASFQERSIGSIEVGKMADLVLLDRDPTRVDAEDIPGTEATLTMIGGRVVWRG